MGGLRKPYKGIIRTQPLKWAEKGLPIAFHSQLPLKGFLLWTVLFYSSILICISPDAVSISIVLFPDPLMYVSFFLVSGISESKSPEAVSTSAENSASFGKWIVISPDAESSFISDGTFLKRSSHFPLDVSADIFSELFIFSLILALLLFKRNR